MDTNAIGLLGIEAEEASVPIRKVIEGLTHDLELHDSPEATRENLSVALASYARRIDLLDKLVDLIKRTKQAILDLLADGHPELPFFEVNGDVLKDLDENLEAILAARAIFTLRALTVSGEFEAEGRQHAPRP